MGETGCGIMKVNAVFHRNLFALGGMNGMTGTDSTVRMESKKSTLVSTGSITAGLLSIVKDRRCSEWLYTFARWMDTANVEPDQNCTAVCVSESLSHRVEQDRTCGCD